MGTRVIPHDRQSKGERILVTALGDVEDRESNTSQVHRHTATRGMGELAHQQLCDETGLFVPSLPREGSTFNASQIARSAPRATEMSVASE